VLQLSENAQSTLHDCGYGLRAGRSFDGPGARDPKGVGTWLRDPAATPHGRESMLSLMNRIADWLAGENGQHHQSIVVTHASFIRAAIVHAIEATPQSCWRIDFAPLSVTH
jgi:broad specificity phosphatase PhoE